MYGFGRLIRVDLGSGQVRVEDIPEELKNSFLGGRGINSAILLREVPADCDPLGPENKLIFGTGPLGGTIAPCSGRWTVTAKSPTTDAFGDANAGGHWAAELKWAGYQHIIFEGMSPKPVYLWIDDDRIELRDASRLWGSDVWVTTDIVRKELGDEGISVACIGPAGERLALTACVLCDYTRGAGKCGMGTVMGSKQLKAIAVRGTKGVQVADAQATIDAVREGLVYIQKGDKWWWENFSTYGTPIFVDMFNELGTLPTRNWHEGYYERASELSGTALYDKYGVKKRSCNGCFYHCSPYVAVKDGLYAGTVGEGVEYEATGGFGAKLANPNLASTIHAKTLVDKYGLDLINTTDTIGWAIECYERGLLTKEDTDGLEMTWGNHRSIVEAVRRMAYKEGKFGELLALGSRKASQKIGRGTEYYSITIKGQQMGLVEPRAEVAWGLGFGVSTRGGDHLRAQPAMEFMWTPEQAKEYIGSEKAVDRFSTEGKGLLVFWAENMKAVQDSMENCKYWFRGQPKLWWDWPPHMINAVTGWNLTPEDVFNIGQRVVLAERAFNAKAGLTRREDHLPERFYEEAQPTGPAKGAIMPRDKWEKMLDEYYSHRGCDKNGIPVRSKLEELGVKWIADDLEKHGKLGAKE